MKNRLISGCLFIILGGLIALGPFTIFPACGVASTQETTESGKGQESMQMEEKSEASKENAATSTMAKKEMTMKCFWTARAELGVGIVIVLLGILLLATASVPVRQGLNISLILLGVLALLIPTGLIGVCKSIHMSCHSLMSPALAILGGIVSITAAVNAIFLYKSVKKGQGKA